MPAGFNTRGNWSLFAFVIARCHGHRLLASGRLCKSPTAVAAIFLHLIISLHCCMNVWHTPPPIHHKQLCGVKTMFSRQIVNPHGELKKNEQTPHIPSAFADTPPLAGQRNRTASPERGRRADNFGAPPFEKGLIEAMARITLPVSHCLSSLRGRPVRAVALCKQLYFRGGPVALLSFFRSF